MNNRGFMMAEVVVVSSLILVTLVGFYTSYNKIIALYNKRIDYYDVATLYELANIRDNKLEELNIGENNVSGDIVYYINKDDVKNENINVDDLNPTFIDYLDYLSTSLDYDRLTNNILVMENCINNDNCKYAYLEVFNDKTSEQ